MSIKARVLSGMALIAMLGTVAPLSAKAANIPTYDDNIARTRLIVDPSMSPTQLYLSAPVYLHLPGESISTPTIVGGVMYQYTYGGGIGTLYAIKMPTVDTTAILRQYGFSLPHYLTYPTQYVETPLVFRPSEGSRGADAQDSLTTLNGYQAIAVGKHLYSWAQNQWPSNSILKSLGVEIQPAPGDVNQQQVDMSPLITPPVPVRVINMSTLRTATVSASLSVACSWDGGCTATPLGLPAGDIGSTLRYAVTQDFPSDTSGAITSDPVYVPSDPMFRGSPPAVAFGVASWSRPRIEVLDLLNGQAKSLGVGKIAVPVTDALMYATPSGSAPMIVAHDLYGNVYTFALNGKLTGVVPSHSTTPEMGVDGSLTHVAWKGSVASVLQPTDGGSEVAIAPIPGEQSVNGGYIDFVGASSPSTVLGGPVSLPWCKGAWATACRYVSAWSYSNLRNPATGKNYGPGIVVLSGGVAGASYVRTASFSNGGEMLSAKTAPFVGVLLDVGAQHDMVSWSNSTQVGGALELWVPVKYGVTAEATPTTVSSGSPVTISARPVPAGVTASRLPWHPCSTGSSPVTVKLTSSLGTSGYLNLTRTVTPTPSNPWSTWTANYRLPANDTGHPVTWRGVVQATDKFCSSATSAVSVVEEPGASVVPSSGGPGLRLSPNPALWSQWVTATLTPSAPALPSGESLVSWSISSAKLAYPAKNPNWATSLPYPPTQLGASKSMTTNGHTATAKFLENFWDGGCHTPVAGACVWIVNGLDQLSQQATIPALKSAVTATYTLKITESHQVRSCTTKIDPATGQPVIDPTTGKPEQVCTTKTVTTRFTTAPQTATASLEVDGTAKDAVGGG